MDDRIKILLVDDEPRNLDALASFLDTPSYFLLRADSANLALKLLLEHEVATIVLDVEMPGVSGLGLAHLIEGTEKHQQIPIIFLTAHPLDEKDVPVVNGAGGIDYVTKPVNPRILQHKVAMFGHLFRTTRALAELNERLEARVRERTAELEHTNRMKDEFLAMLSHELRSPLTAILAWQDILRNEPLDPIRLEHGLDVIGQAAKVQARMITDLLDISRIVSGKLRLNTGNFLLSQAIRAAIEVVRPASDSKGVRLLVELSPQVGLVFGDPDRIQQVVWNLLTNAIRHTPTGGCIGISVKCVGSSNVLRVKDTGTGIPAEQLPYIFDRFRQVDSSTTRAAGGLGLGLALVRHLVEAHGGHVEARSEGPECGATFTVFLPAPSMDDPHAGPSQARAEVKAGAEAKAVDASHPRQALIGALIPAPTTS